MKNKVIAIFIICIIVIGTTISIFKGKKDEVDAATGDVYDIILFWGQSQMVGYPTLDVDMPSQYWGDIMKRMLSAAHTNIDHDIISNTHSMSRVSTPLDSESAYIYKYLSNSFEEIQKDTHILGDGMSESEYNDGSFHGLTYNPSTGKLEKYIPGQSSHISIQTYGAVNMIPEFCRTYYEQTGHKVIAVTGAVGGAPIQTFLPKSDPNHMSCRSIFLKY